MQLRALTLAVVLLVVGGAVQAERTTRILTGELSYLERITLTPDSVVVVEFRDDQGQLDGQTRFPTEGRQIPLPFAIEVPVSTAGALRGAIWSHGHPTWVSEPHPVSADTEPQDVGGLRLRQFNAERFVARLRCGDKPVEIDFPDEQARMRIDNEHADLYPVKTASGARYEARDDPQTFYWSKGNNALVGWDGETLPECAPAVPAPVDSFTASGNEPGWTLRITGNRIRLNLDYGTREIETELPAPRHDDGTTAYRLAEAGISVEVDEQVCRDDMTGMPHPARVIIETEEGRLRGCGGDPRALLEGSEWTVTAIADAPVPDGVSMTLNFLDGDRIAGSSGCNRFTSSYDLTGEGLSVDKIASTMMACPDTQMELERRFLDTLREVARFRIPEPATLVLETNSDQQITAKR